MAARYDVASRLAEGREAVAHTQTYVSACRRAGYQHTDLTGYDGQALDWYDGEDGLDLSLLDDDRARLRAAVGATEEALRIQRTGLDALAAGWRGPGAQAAAAFLRGHCAAGEALVDGLRAATRACETLRDELWRRVDAKVATAIDVDDAVGAQRAGWLAAAHTQDADVIEQQLKPYVDNDIRGRWLEVMRSCRTGIAADYRGAERDVTPPGMVFAIPGELGPRREAADAVAAAAAGVPVAPVGPAVGVDPAPVPSPPPPVSSPPPESPAPPVRPTTGTEPDTAAWPADAGLPGFGLPGGLPASLGGLGGMGGLGPRLADGFGGLLGSPGADAFDDLPFEDARSGDDPDGADKPGDLDEPGDPDGAAEPGDPDAAGQVVDETAAEPDPEPPAGDGAVVPADETEVPADEPDAVAVDQPDSDPPPAAPAKTPCEMAADELPQAGQ